jgi:TRAP-type mannitol/chloroaromatic compound transport system substrate-binding protein
VLDAVGGGVAELGHTASFYWQGKRSSPGGIAAE